MGSSSTLLAAPFLPRPVSPFGQRCGQPSTHHHWPKDHQPEHQPIVWLTSLIGASGPDGAVAQYWFSDITSGAGSDPERLAISGTSATCRRRNSGRWATSGGASGGSNQTAIEAIDNPGLASPNFRRMTSTCQPATRGYTAMVVTSGQAGSRPSPNHGVRL